MNALTISKVLCYSVLRSTLLSPVSENSFNFTEYYKLVLVLGICQFLESVSFKSINHRLSGPHIKISACPLYLLKKEQQSQNEGIEGSYSPALLGLALIGNKIMFTPTLLKRKAQQEEINRAKWLVLRAWHLHYMHGGDMGMGGQRVYTELLLWVSPGRQPSPTQPLAHSSAARWGRESGG